MREVKARCKLLAVISIVMLVLNIILFYYSFPDVVMTSLRTFIDSVYNTTGGRQAEEIASESDYVPNIIHFIWFAANSTKKLTFVNYISILSAHKIHKPDSIYLHCNFRPSGQWWDQLRQNVNLTVLHREAPTEIFGQRLAHLFHAGDVAKLEIMIQYGGIYLDLDVVVINSLNPLRKYNVTLGREKPPKFIAGVIIANKNAEFLQLWRESYRNNYYPEEWDYNYAVVTYKLYKRRPELVHVEPYKLTTPDWTDRHDLWNNTIDWHQLYVIHIMGHQGYPNFTPESIQRINSTFGQVMRYIYYDNWAIMD